MTRSLDPSVPPQPLRQVLVEVALIFTVFFLQGAWPAPDVNEPYYLGKAIHFWNPDWIPGDFFLDTADTHTVFNAVFGWLSLILPPLGMAWFGRVLTWGLLAWAWQRLSFAVLPRRWFSMLSAALFVCLLERFHMAGEWLVGGVEAKGFAYVLVFLGLESLVRNRWNRTWLLLGGASLFHVLVGGWSAVAAGFAWLVGKDRPPLRALAPALAGGFLLALPALIAGLRLDWGAPAETARQAHEIYVYRRLYHHLDLTQVPLHFIVRFSLLVTAFGLLAWSLARNRAIIPGRERMAEDRARAFVVGTLAIALVGATINGLAPLAPAIAASLLRFYWFRLSDVGLALGVSLLGMAFIAQLLATWPRVGRACLLLALAAATFHVGQYAVRRPRPVVPRPDQHVSYVNWRKVCNWIARSGKIPPDARFLTPKPSQTFKWYAQRAEVVSWKEIPQDAQSIVEWWRRMEDVHGAGREDIPWRLSLTEIGPERLKQLGVKYGANYLLTEARPRLPLKRLYPSTSAENRWYAVYELGVSPERGTSGGQEQGASAK